MGDLPTLTINGKVYEISSDVGPNERLVNFLHDQKVRGTHYYCFQGGCGSCIVTASVPNPITGLKDTYAINSCLVPVLSCNDWDITTVEGLGSSRDGYHVIQDRLAQYAGSQCGYCSPGLVMNMYGLTQSNPSWTSSDVEKCLDANICRCTGYRPIMEAFKSITPIDIEDAHLSRCPKSGKPCQGKCSAGVKEDIKKGLADTTQTRSPKLNLSSRADAYQPNNLQELYQIIGSLPAGDRYSLIVGNTAQAVVGTDTSSTATIFIRNIPELQEVKPTTESVAFGASVSIGLMMQEMRKISSTSGFAYLDHLANTWQILASTTVRNLGSWAGNIATRISHTNFPSDLFTHLVAAGATITLGVSDSSTSTHSLEDLLGMDLVAERKVILQLTLPRMSDAIFFRVFKVSQRLTNAYAYVNAGFRMQVDTNNAHTVVGSPNIVFGCINSTFVHAVDTEAALAGKSLQDNSVIQKAMTALASELTPTETPVDASPDYKVALAQNMLYKAILDIIGDVTGSDLVSGATDLERPLSSSQQTYDQNPETWPLGKPIPKLDANIQCSGEAEYVILSPMQTDELFGVFVTSTQSNAHIVSIDSSAALAMPGVVTFVGLQDIGGINNTQSFCWPFAPQPLFAEDRVSFYGQPIGVIVAKERGQAYAGAAAVQVTYDDIQPPILTIDEALQNPLPGGQFPQFVHGDINAGFASSTRIIEGSMHRTGQHHFPLEAQVCVATPTDEGLEISAGTQWLSETQRSVGQVLGIPDNKIYVTVKRVGGAFGSKLSQGNVTATAAALAAYKTRAPVRISLNLKENMTIIGWRETYKCTYKVGVDDAGLLQAVQAIITCDTGYVGVDCSVMLALESIPSCYECQNWEVTPQFVFTNTASNTWCRSPGTMDGIVFMENIMDHVANEIGMDPLEFRRKNLMPDGATRVLSEDVIRFRNRLVGNLNPTIPREIKILKNLIGDMIDQIMVSANVEARQQAVETFNLNNKWKKRGIAVMPQLWPYTVPPAYPANSMVSINARDGTVIVSHGGCEYGQGINTKVAQCAAYELGIPLEMIAVKGSNTHPNANTHASAGSYGADTSSFVVSMACRTIKQRLEDFRATLEDPNIEWASLVLQAFNKGIDICERYVNKWAEVKSYSVFGVAVTEVELDVLTGQYLILRTDILEDAGRSMSPLVDIGQVEGAFIMGKGLFTTEKVVYDPLTGEKLSNSTWYYKPPQALDIPIDFRVTLLQNASNPVGVQSSKVTGDAPLILSFSVVMALRQAVTSARADGGTTGWFQMDPPMTVEKLQRLCLVDPSRLIV